MGWFSSSESKKLNWIQLTSKAEVDDIFDIDINNELSKIIFKHSTRCSISTMALSRFEKEWVEVEDTKLYFLDLIKFREVSDYVAEKSLIVHQSPQLIAVKEGKVVYNNSHNGISAGEITTVI